MEMEFKYRDNKEQSRIYDEEYAKGKYGNRKNRAVRHGLHYDWISARIEKTDDVLVTSCGRGELVRMFLENGFHSVGTEISDWVIENHLQDIECFKLHYSELGTLANNRYDVIVSNDVLEHLNNEEEAGDAIKEFARIAKKYVTFSVGVGTKPQFFHPLVKPAEWWRELIGKYLDIIDEDFFKDSQFFFCEVRR